MQKTQVATIYPSQFSDCHIAIVCSVSEQEISRMCLICHSVLLLILGQGAPGAFPSRLRSSHTKTLRLMHVKIFL